MKNSEQIYKLYGQAYRDILKKPRKTVKDFDKFIKKFPYIESLLFLTGSFNTFWSNIEPYKFFRIGFKLYKEKFNLNLAVEKSNIIIEGYKKVEILRSKKIKNEKETSLKALKYLSFSKNFKKLSIEEYFLKFLLKDLIEHKINIPIFILLIERNKTCYEELKERGYIANIEEIYEELKKEDPLKYCSLELRNKIIKGLIFLEKLNDT